MINRKRNRTIAIVMILLCLVMAALLIVSTTESLGLRAALEEARARLEADKPPITLEKRDPIPTNGYVMLGGGTIGSMKLFYYGDDSFYGRGLADTAPGVMAEGATSTLIHREIARAYGKGGSIGGLIITYTGKAHTTEQAIIDCIGNYANYAMDFRLAILAPSDENIAMNREAIAGKNYRGTLTGEADKDVEALVRTIREGIPRCDILLAVPHNASDELAEIILALGAHYNLVTVDLRPIAAIEGAINQDGADIGYPTDEGHRLIAEAVNAAIDGAVREAHRSSGELPTKLYE